MSIDSRAVFEGRIVAIGLGDFLPRFRELGWQTYAEFAFATTYAPGQGDDDRFRLELVVPLLGEAGHVKTPAVRRLFFEAYTLAGADLKRRAEGTTDDAPRKVPNEERYERRLRLASRLPNIKLEGELDVSNRLLDACVEIYEDNVLRYIPWEECTKLAMELQGQKKDRIWIPDSSGTIREKRVELESPRADLSSDLRLRFALTRRSLAMEMGDLLAFEIHEQLADCLISAYMKVPPPGHVRVTLDQLKMADLEAFHMMAMNSRQGIKRNAGNARPLDALLPSILSKVEFLMLLQPTPMQLAKRVADTDLASAGGGKRAVKRARKEQRLSQNASPEYQAPQPFHKGKGKGKNRGKKGNVGNMGWSAAGSSDRPLPWMRGAAGRAPPMPPALAGKAFQHEGKRICFDFNLPQGCPHAPAGGQCYKGWHICAEPGCGQAHSLVNHQ